jgi:Transposase DDE domain
MTGHNPTDRSKLGTKRHILTDKDGIPLSAIITSANTHDVTVAIDTVDSMVLKRSSSKLNDRKKQNLCLDKAYHSKEIEQEIIKRFFYSCIYLHYNLALKWYFISSYNSFIFTIIS